MLTLNMDAVFEFDPLHSACMKHEWGGGTCTVCVHKSCICFQILSFFSSNQSNACFCVITAPNRPTTPLTTGALMPPPRPSSRPKLPTGKLTGINEIVSSHPRVCSGTLITFGMAVYLCNGVLFGRSPSLRYDRSAHLRCPTPALPRLPHLPEQRALLRCPRTRRSVLGTPRPLVRFH